METTKKLIFDPNTMATTVGANSLNVETMVSQPIYDPAELKVDGLDYVFDQAKFEEHLSSSSSRISPCLARAHAVIRKVQESRSAKESSHKVGIPKFAEKQPQNYACTRDTSECLARRPGTRDTSNCLARSSCPRDTCKCLARSSCTRDTCKCLARRTGTQDTCKCIAQSSFTRDTSNCLGQREDVTDTSNCPDQTSSPPLHLSTAQADVSTAKPEKSTSVFNRPGPWPRNQGKAPVHERLSYARQCTGGRTTNPADVQKCPDQAETSQPPGILTISRLSIPQGVRETIEKDNSKHAIVRKVTRDDNTMLIHASTTLYDRRPKVSLSECTRSVGQYSQKKTCPPIKDNVTLGGGNLTQQAVRRPNQPRHYAGGGNMQKRTIDKTDCSCSYTQLVKTLLAGCACFESNAHLQRASIFEKLSLPATEESKLKRRCFQRRRSAIQRDEFLEVTINMVNKRKGTATADSEPDFTPGGKVSSQISQSMSRLQLRATQRVDYRRMHEGDSSEDEDSDANSAIASDDTMSSVGQAREAYTITPETLAQMLQEALAKQKEELRAEMKTEMELAMQQMRELQGQKVARPESGQQGGPSHHVAHDIEDSDTEVDEHIFADPPPQKTASGAQSGGGLTNPRGNNPKRGNDNGGKMKELEGKVNALMSAQEVKRTGIPCPYPREWDSIPYPSKFNMINFTPFDGKGSPTQHLIYFKSHLGVISGNEPLMIRSFVGTLRGAAFDWYRRLKDGSINCWDDMESLFLSNFFDDDTDVSIGTLLDEKQKSGESIDAFVKRFRSKAVNCKDPITEEFILQTCHNNLSIDLLEVMGVVPPTTWKDLKIRGEQAERFLKRKKTERSKTTADPSEDASKSEFHGTYSFTDEEVPIIFKHLLDSNKIKLPPITNQEEADKTSDPKYCAYHRRVHHPTKSCFVLKDSIQALIDAGIIMSK